MAVTRIILPRPEQPEDSNALQDPCAPGIPSNLVEQCTSIFQARLEQAAAKQHAVLQAVETQLFGVQGCIFNPRFETSVYDSEDQDYHYPIVPDFEGLLLIKGLPTPAIRFAGEDQWSLERTELWWSVPNIFTIKENARIVVNYFDIKITLRSKNRRRLIGNFVVLNEIHELVPFN